jgi:hypothetical protein
MENSLGIYRMAVADTLFFAKNILGFENKAISQNIAIQESVLSRLKTQQYGKQLPYYKDLYNKLLTFLEKQTKYDYLQELQNLKDQHAKHLFNHIELAKPINLTTKNEISSSTANTNHGTFDKNLVRGFSGTYDIYHLASNIREGAISKSVLTIGFDGVAILVVPTENDNTARREGVFRISIGQSYLFLEFPENLEKHEFPLYFCIYASKDKRNGYEAVYFGIGRFSKKPMVDKAYFIKIDDNTQSLPLRFYAQNGRFIDLEKSFEIDLLNFLLGATANSKIDALSIHEMVKMNLISNPLIKWLNTYNKIAGVYTSYSHNFKLETEESEIIAMPIEILPNGVVYCKGSKNLYIGRCRWDGGALAIQLYERKAYNSEVKEVYLGFMMYFIGRSGSTTYNSGIFAFLEDQNNLACGREILVKEKDVVFEDMLYRTIPFSKKDASYRELNTQTHICDYLFGKTDNEIIVKPLPKNASQGINRDYEDYGLDFFHASLGYALQENDVKTKSMLKKAFSHGFATTAKERKILEEYTEKGKILHKYLKWIEDERNKMH